MLFNTSDLTGYAIQAVDGELGKLVQLYFDDTTWAVRYLVVETRGWLDAKQVLISPASITGVDSQAKHLHLRITRQQVELSPNIDTQQPVSRQHEAAYLTYYGLPFYWEGPNLWGPDVPPAGLASGLPESMEAVDSHLRSTDGIAGYHIEATDGELGHVDSFVVDSDTWRIRYLEVATRDWWPGKKVLVSPAWVESVSWMDSEVAVALTRAAIQNAPEYDSSQPISRDYEKSLYLHYGRPPYWTSEDKAASAVGGFR